MEEIKDTIANGIIIFVIVLGVIALLACFSLALAWPFMLLWNYAVVSAITIANPISYWVAFWLMMFIALFVSSTRSSSSSK